MGQSFNTLLGRVRVQADVDVTDVTDSEITNALIDAYMEALADEPWPFLQARTSFMTIGGQAEYGQGVVGASDSSLEIQRIRRVQLNGLDLRRIEAEDYYSVNPQGGTVSTGGKVLFWSTLEGSLLALWPPPADGLSCRVIYTQMPAAVGGTALTVWPQRYDYVLIAGALVYVFQKIGDFDSAEIKKREFSDGVRTIRADAMKPQTYTPRYYGGGADVARRPLGPHWDWQYGV